MKHSLKVDVPLREKWVTNPRRKADKSSTMLERKGVDEMIRDPNFKAIFGWLPVN